LENATALVAVQSKIRVSSAQPIASRQLKSARQHRLPRCPERKAANEFNVGNLVHGFKLGPGRLM